MTQVWLYPVILWSDDGLDVSVEITSATLDPDAALKALWSTQRELDRMGGARYRVAGRSWWRQSGETWYECHGQAKGALRFWNILVTESRWKDGTWPPFVPSERTAEVVR